MRNIFFALLVSMAYPAHAETLHDGLDAYEANEFETAFEFLQPHAEGGHPLAQSLLGMMLYEGRGVSQDYTRAAYWMLQAA
jgi:TPR repeat protein